MPTARPPPQYQTRLSDESWRAQCEYMEKTIPALHKFLETWGPHCGASRNVFRGHLCVMLMNIKEPTK